MEIWVIDACRSHWKRFLRAILPGTPLFRNQEISEQCNRELDVITFINTLYKNKRSNFTYRPRLPCRRHQL